MSHQNHQLVKLVELLKMKLLYFKEAIQCTGRYTCIMPLRLRYPLFSFVHIHTE